MVVVLVLVFIVLMAVAFGPKMNTDQMLEPLINKMRSIAQEPVPERSDPRFKQWKDVRTRFPAPPGGRYGFPGADFARVKPVKAIGGRFWRTIGRFCGLAWRELRNVGKSRERLK
jgi:hypothetical protein